MNLVTLCNFFSAMLIPKKHGRQETVPIFFICLHIKLFDNVVKKQMDFQITLLNVPWSSRVIRNKTFSC